MGEDYFGIRKRQKTKCLKWKIPHNLVIYLSTYYMDFFFQNAINFI